MIIEDMRTDYHRNGVGGEGSYVAMFRVTSADIGERVPFMGIFWGQDENGKGPTECMLMRCVDVAEPLTSYVEGQTPEGLGSRNFPESMNAWRSTDHFLPHLLEPLKEAMNQHYAIIRGRFTRREAQPSKAS